MEIFGVRRKYDGKIRKGATEVRGVWGVSGHNGLKCPNNPVWVSQIEKTTQQGGVLELVYRILLKRIVERHACSNHVIPTMNIVIGKKKTQNPFPSPSAWRQLIVTRLVRADWSYGPRWASYTRKCWLLINTEKFSHIRIQVTVYRLQFVYNPIPKSKWKVYPDRRKFWRPKMGPIMWEN